MPSVYITRRSPASRRRWCRWNVRARSKTPSGGSGRVASSSTVSPAPRTSGGGWPQLIQLKTEYTRFQRAMIAVRKNPAPPTSDIVSCIVHAAAGQAHAVLADRRIAPWPAAPRPAVSAQRSHVHDAEARRGESDEQRRVFGHRVGCPLTTAQAGDNQLVGIAAVALQPRRVDRKTHDASPSVGAGRLSQRDGGSRARLDVSTAYGDASKTSRARKASVRSRADSRRPVRLERAARQRRGA